MLDSCGSSEAMGLRDPAGRIADEEARFPPHGKRAISFGKYDNIELFRQAERIQMYALMVSIQLK